MVNGNGTRKIELSDEVLQMLAGLLAQVQVPAGAQDFEAQAALVTKARRELGAALRAAETVEVPEDLDLSADVSS